MSGRFRIRTYGCQMNVHDSDKVANLLHHHRWTEAPGEDQADLLVINTCSIREKAEHQLYSDLGALRDWKQDVPGRALGVGGCVAQQEGDALLRRFSHLDFVFGTHNLRRVPAMVEAARGGERSVRVDETRSLERFDLPERHPAVAERSPGRAFVTVMEGCDMFCSFCVVPRTRGREISRRADDIVSEVEGLAARGISEITLLGQTVNAYGRHDVRRERTVAAGTVGFAELLTRLDAVPGIERIRYTSPHPLFFDDALVAAHGSLTALCPHVHLPTQSGSDRILEIMRRRYRAADVGEIAAALRAARPDIVLTTDLIVGHPGETDEDFRATLALVEAIGFVDAYTFKYSPRPGTRAMEEADRPGAPAPVPAEIAQARLETLQALQRDLTLAAHRSRVGQRTRVLVEGPSRRGATQVRGRDPWHRVVNFDAAEAGLSPEAAAGAWVEVEIVEATPHSLIGAPLAARATDLGAPGPGTRPAPVSPLGGKVVLDV